MPMQNNHYVAESTSPHMLMPPSNNYTDPSCAPMFNNEYSPDNSSYSENSDYTSDDFEDDLAEKGQSLKHHEMYPHQSTYISNSQQDMMHVMSSMSPASSSSTSSNILPPFPTINSGCDLSSSNYKEDHCQSYQDSSMHLNPYNSYSHMPDNLPSQHTASLYSYDIHSSSHYGYTNEFHKDDNFAPTIATSHLVAESSSNELVNSIELVADTNVAQQQQPQQYIDLSLSIASSSSSLLSTANTSDEDSRLTPVSFTHIQPLNSSSYYSVTDNSSSLCQSSFDQSYSQQKSNIPECSAAPYGEVNEADQKSPDNLSANDNFGEIIKKTIVESVSA